MPIVVHSDRGALMEAAAERVVACAGEAIRAHGAFHWALAGGSTPASLYRLLATPGHARRVDWSRVHFYFGDERCVPPEHPDSNYRMAREALLDRLAPAPEQVHRMQGELAPALAAERYEGVLEQCFNRRVGSGWPAFDLVLLGMGADGHTASLFPGTSALREARRWVVANVVESLGVTRLTLTLPAINAALDVLFLVAGADKAERLEQVLSGSAPAPLPAQLVRPRREPEWLIDAVAASRLGMPARGSP